jgi:hypothetical protein
MPQVPVLRVMAAAGINDHNLAGLAEAGAVRECLHLLRDSPLPAGVVSALLHLLYLFSTHPQVLPTLARDVASSPSSTEDAASSSRNHPKQLPEAPAAPDLPKPHGSFRQEAGSSIPSEPAVPLPGQQLPLNALPRAIGAHQCGSMSSDEMADEMDVRMKEEQEEGGTTEVCDLGTMAPVDTAETGRTQHTSNGASLPADLGPRGVRDSCPAPAMPKAAGAERGDGWGSATERGTSAGAVVKPCEGPGTGEPLLLLVALLQDGKPGL